MVRMCADGVKPEASRLNYPSALHGLWRIAREEGLAKCFRGIGPTVLRSVIMNASQLSCYDMIKEALLGTGRIADGVPLHLLTSALGGTVAVTLVAPVDVMKSRIQSSTEGATAAQIVARSLRNEGVAVLFRGWAPAWLRMAPTTMLTFMFFEQLKKIF
ncbi:Carrier protein, mitochondrial [Cryptotrichosporon argae]